MKKNLNLVTAPATEPLTTAEVKTHLRITTSDDDTYIDNLITTVRQLVELYTDRALITQTWQLFMDQWPSSYYEEWWNGVRDGVIGQHNRFTDIAVPRAPLQSVTHIKTYSDDDTATTFNSSNYHARTYSGDAPNKGRIVLKEGQAWPDFTRTVDGIEIQFVCGYGTASDVPKQIKQAMLEEIAYRYENRGECDSMELRPLTKSYLNMYRLIEL